MSDPEPAALLGVLVDASMKLRELATSLRQCPNVVAVDRRCDIEGADGTRSIEWYVDAELRDGQAISFRLLIYWQSAEWTVESDVRRIHAAGSDEEVGLPTRYAVGISDLAAEARSAVAQLVRCVQIDGLFDVE